MASNANESPGSVLYQTPLAMPWRCFYSIQVEFCVKYWRGTVKIVLFLASVCLCVWLQEFPKKNTFL